jgi:hypothetical protein
MIVEPALIGILGGILYLVYREYGWNPWGLPYFLLIGVPVLAFIESLNKKIWQRRIDKMNDGRIEGEAMAGDYRRQYGD